MIRYKFRHWKSKYVRFDNSLTTTVKLGKTLRAKGIHLLSVCSNREIFAIVEEKGE